MKLEQLFENEVRKEKYFSVRFGIDSEDFETNENVTFGENYSFETCNGEYNYQPILLEGKEIGVLEEHSFSNVFKPVRHSFKVYVKKEYQTENEHFMDEEFGNVMAFSNIRDAISFYRHNTGIIDF